MKNVLMVVIILAAVLLAVGCGQSSPASTSVASSASSTSETTTVSIPAVASKLVSVTISNLAFNPKDVTIPVNAKVTWTNNDSATHSVTSDSGLFESPALKQGSWFTYSFSEVGTFPYHCKFHAEMTGTVIVQ
jgi:plastocyanin